MARRHRRRRPVERRQRPLAVRRPARRRRSPDRRGGRSNGALLDIGPHLFDLLDAALGTIVDVRAATFTEPDLWHVVCAHDGGAVSTASLSMRLPIDPSVLEFDVYGSGGRLALSPRQTHAVECFAHAARRAGGDDPFRHHHAPVRRPPRRPPAAHHRARSADGRRPDGRSMTDVTIVTTTACAGARAARRRRVMSTRSLKKQSIPCTAVA